MPRVVCTACGRRLRLIRVGVKCVEDDDAGRPYKLWYADLWRCPECGVEVLAGFGTRPVSERHEAGFMAEVEGGIKYHWS
jgi:hypothetical protein